MSEAPTLSELKQRVAQLEKEQKHLLKLVSHDVKSPYNKLYALSNLLQLTADNLGDEQKEYLLRMDWVIKEGLTVVRNLMDLRAIDSNQTDLHIEEVNITDALGDCLNGYQKQIGLKKIKLELFDKKVTAQSDKRYVDRVIDNLVSNAVKFSPTESKIEVLITESGNDWLLSVNSESGPIPKDEVDKLFEKHTTLSTRPTFGENALGNGLFIAQSFAKKLGGKIEFTQKGDQVIFSFTLPKNL